MSRGMTYEERRAREAWELAQDQNRLSTFRRSLPSMKTSELFQLLRFEDLLRNAVGSNYQITIVAVVRDIYAEIDQRMPPREQPVDGKEGA